MEALTIETSRDLGSASPRTKLRADTWLAILQGISPCCYHTRYSLHCKQSGLYETSPTETGSPPVTIETRASFLSVTQAGSPPVTIETRASFLSATQAGSPLVTTKTRHILYLWRVFPICHHRNKTYLLLMKGVPHLLLKKNCYSLLCF